MSAKSPAEAGGAARVEDPRPRYLGDEWADWRPGMPLSQPTDGPGTYLLIALLLSLTAAAALILLLWLAAPRLAALGVSTSILRVIGSFFVLSLLLPVALLRAALWGLRLPWSLASRLLRLSAASWSAARSLAGFFRIDRDRLGHSFVHVSNGLVEAAHTPRSAAPVLLLAPRCLKAPLMKAVKALAAEAGVCVAVVVGGEEARFEVRRCAPSGVLAVACERDLVAGILEVGPQVPVIGIPNRRPEGPCRNSEIDLEEVKRKLALLQTKVMSGVQEPSGVPSAQGASGG